MFRKLFSFFIISLSIAGCAHKAERTGVISEQLPLTVDDLAEIKEGKRNHERVLWEYREYKSPNLEKYCNVIAATLAEVSTRPHLPYRVFLLDSDEILIFGGPGGYIYMTRGVFDFVESESELAGALAHEIIHVANFEYSSIPHATKIQKAYNLALQGTEFAKNSIGTYGTAANLGLKGLGKAAPVVARKFGKDEEVETDTAAVDVLLKAGYDPRGYLKFIDKLSKVEMDSIENFATFMNTHPPFADRRTILNNKIGDIGLDEGKIAFKKDMMLAEIRQEAVNTKDAIVFQPRTSAGDAAETQTLASTKKEEMTTYRGKRWALF